MHIKELLMPYSHQVFIYFVRVDENKFVVVWVVFKWTLPIWCDEPLMSL